MADVYPNLHNKMLVTFVKSSSGNECINYCIFGSNTTKINKNKQIYYCNLGGTTMKFQKIVFLTETVSKSQCSHGHMWKINKVKGYSNVNLVSKRQKNINKYSIAILV